MREPGGLVVLTYDTADNLSGELQTLPQTTGSGKVQPVWQVWLQTSHTLPHCQNGSDEIPS